MSKRVLIVLVIALTAYAAVMTYINHGQGVLLDRVLRCASSTYMQAMSGTVDIRSEFSTLVS